MISSLNFHHSHKRLNSLKVWNQLHHSHPHTTPFQIRNPKDPIKYMFLIPTTTIQMVPTHKSQRLSLWHASPVDKSQYMIRTQLLNVSWHPYNMNNMYIRPNPGNWHMAHSDKNWLFKEKGQHLNQPYKHWFPASHNLKHLSIKKQYLELNLPSTTFKPPVTLYWRQFLCWQDTQATAAPMNKAYTTTSPSS